MNLKLLFVDQKHSRVNKVWLQQIPIALISEPVPSEESFPFGPLLAKGLYLSIFLFSTFEVSSKLIICLPNFRVSAKQPKCLGYYKVNLQLTTRIHSDPEAFFWDSESLLVSSSY